MRTDNRRVLPLVLSLAAAWAAADAAALVVENERRVAAAVASFMARVEAPSASVAVAKGGEVVFSRAWGLADLENLVPAEEETVYRIASVAKPLTAVAVLQLVAAGELDLAAPIRRYLPSFPERYGEISVRELLTHTGGIRHYAPGEFASTRRCEELAEGLDAFLGDAVASSPGEVFNYSTYGYVLLGLAIENAAGTRYIDYLRERVLEPAGMARTRADDLQAIVPNRAAGYAKAADGGVRNADLVDTSCRIPGGGLVAPAEDLVRFGIALLDGKLLDPSLVREMTSPQVSAEIHARTLRHLDLPADFEPPDIGYGWAIGTAKNPAAVYHGGNQQGATSMLYLLPAEELTVAVLTNIEGEGEAITELAEEIAAVFR